MVHNSAVKLFVVFRFLPSRSLYKSPFSTSVSTLYQAINLNLAVVIGPH